MTEINTVAVAPSKVALTMSYIFCTLRGIAAIGKWLDLLALFSENDIRNRRGPHGKSWQGRRSGVRPIISLTAPVIPGIFSKDALVCNPVKQAIPSLTFRSFPCLRVPGSCPCRRLQGVYFLWGLSSAPSRVAPCGACSVPPEVSTKPNVQRMHKTACA